MRYLLSIILAVLLVLTAEGKIVPASDVENQQTGTQPLQLSDHIKEAQNIIANVSASFQQLSLPNQEEFVNTLKEHSISLMNNVQNYLHNMSDEYRRATSSHT